MRAIGYDLEFKGQVAQIKEGVFHVTSTAASSTISTVVSASGVREKAAATRGGKAFFESDVTITGKDTFQEKGRINSFEKYDCLGLRRQALRSRCW